MPDYKQIDFDGDAMPLVLNAYRQAKDYQDKIHRQCKRDYLLYRAHVDMTNRDNSLPHIAIPKIYNIVETKAPRDVKALLGTRPYVPFESKRKEYSIVSDAQTELVDQYLEEGGFFLESVLLFKIKTLYGTAFIETMPDVHDVQRMFLLPNPVGGYKLQTFVQSRLRIKIKGYAPWDVLIDPYANNLESREGCRYVIKLDYVSKREIIRMAEQGVYPGLDIEKLSNGSIYNEFAANHFGRQILRDFGLGEPAADDDMGINVRFESPDRYIDFWNGMIPLRDQGNPFAVERGGHGMINLSRIIHNQDPHTQNRIWGIGEAKPNEILQAMMSDYLSNIFRREQTTGEPVIFYRKDALSPDDIIMESGRRIEVDPDNDKPIGDNIHVHSGVPMPAEQFQLLNIVDSISDRTSGIFAPNRGEPSPGDHTLGEIAITRETGDDRQELAIRVAEQVYLRSVGEKTAAHIAQFGEAPDFQEVIGPEKAALLLSANPKLVPGGYRIEFKGSNRISNILIKQRNLKELAPVLTQLFTTNQFQMAQLLLESHEIPAEDIKRIMSENMMNRQMMMQQAAMIEAEAARAGQPGGRYKENNQKQIAQDNGRTMRGK